MKTYEKEFNHLKKDSQNAKILSFLLTEEGRKNGITTMDAFLKFGCTRLAARISELKSIGMDIETQKADIKTPDGTATVAVYKIHSGC